MSYDIRRSTYKKCGATWMHHGQLNQILKTHLFECNLLPEVNMISNKKIENQKHNIFGNVNNYSLIELLCLKAILSKITPSRKIIPISEIANQMFAYYWSIKFDEQNRAFRINEFDDIQRILIKKYGLYNDSCENEIEQVLNYVQDRSLQIRLYGVIKSALTMLAQLAKNKPIEGSLAANLRSNGLSVKPFFSINLNQKIQINNEWHQYFCRNPEQIDLISTMTGYLLKNGMGQVKEDSTFLKKQEKILVKKQTIENNFKQLFEIETRIALHIKLDKSKYCCLEDALSWLEIDIESYNEIHSNYLGYIKNKSVELASKELPFVTSSMLIYTAIFRYNDEDAAGFWPEFFGKEYDYNYVRDVGLVMNCLSNMNKKLGINTEKRHYLQKRNLSEIFSNIYLPEISLKKIYSAIYSAYFRNTKSRMINKIEFIENSQHKLDKAGMFFIKDDILFDDIFCSLVEVMENGIKDNTFKVKDSLPKRFYENFNSWMDHEKSKIDSRKVEYYISSPKIVLDSVNEVLNLCLPKQKIRNYYDDEYCWDICIDGRKIEIPGRIIRQKSGNYLILEEKIKIKTFKNINVRYMLDGKRNDEWEFNVNDNILAFEKNGIFSSKEHISRDGCYLGFAKEVNLSNQMIVDKFEINGWPEYIFYNMDFAEYQGKNFVVNDEIDILIEDKPVLRRSNFKLLFEKWNEFSLYEDTKIYESIGELDIISPYIEKSDLQIIFYSLEDGTDHKNHIVVDRINHNILRMKFSKDICSGVYSIHIKYKNRVFHKETFVLDNETVVKNNYKITYDEANDINKGIFIFNGNGIKILPCDMETRVNEIEQGYSIEAIKTPIAKFIYKRGMSEVVVRKVLKPIKIELSGLDGFVEFEENNKIIEITKESLRNNNVNLYIKNLDYSHEILTYELLLVDNISQNRRSNIQKLKFGEELNWDINDYKDSIMQYKDISVVLSIKDKEGNILFSITKLLIKEHIVIYDARTRYDNNDLIFSWSEEQNNKQRKISLYNITIPSDKPAEFDIEDGETEIRINLSLLKYGVYVPIIGFRKEESLFKNIECRYNFFGKNDVQNSFFNEVGIKESASSENLINSIWMFYKEDFNLSRKLIELVDLTRIELPVILASTIQMKKFAANDEKRVRALLEIAYGVFNKLIKEQGKDLLVKKITELKDKFTKEDILFLLTAALALEKKSELKHETIDALAEIDLISALCSLKNGQGVLTNALKIKCRESFDNQLLMPETIRNHNRIFEIIDEEIEIINGFWNWLTDYKNSYLLKNNYKYSKARLFRIYESEKDISTYRVSGFTIDDMVDNMTESNYSLMPNLPLKWSNELGIKMDVFEDFTRIIKGKKQERYKDILKAAFIAITKISSYKEEDYFYLTMKCQLSNRKDIFNRCRAYLKLIFI